MFQIPACVEKSIEINWSIKPALSVLLHPSAQNDV